MAAGQLRLEVFSLQEFIINIMFFNCNIILRSISKQHSYWIPDDAY